MSLKAVNVTIGNEKIQNLEAQARDITAMQIEQWVGWMDRILDIHRGRLRPVGDKLGFLKKTAQSGYAVILCFIAIADAGVSQQRVAMRAAPASDAQLVK